MLLAAFLSAGVLEARGTAPAVLGSDCCIPGGNGTPGCDDRECESIVCAIDSFCCATEWDGVCADIANDNCPICGAAPPVAAANDECENAEAIAGIPSLVEGTTAGASFDDIGFCGTTNTAPGVWYSLNVAANTGVTATTCRDGGSADYDTSISVFCGDCENTLSDGSVSGPFCCTGNGDDDACGFEFTSTVSWCAEAGREYLILVHGFGMATGDFTMSVEDNGTDCSTGPFCPCAECIVDCEDTENEPNCGVADANSDGTVDSSDDTTNGGCNANLADGSDCCIANGGLGCDDPECVAAVCAVDSFCCTVAWDGLCAELAKDLCGDLCTPLFAFTPLGCNQPLCGSVASSLVVRDTDWLVLSHHERRCVDLCLSSEALMEFGFVGQDIDCVDVQPDFSSLILVDSCTEGCIELEIHPGSDYYFFAAPVEGTDAGCPSEYQLTVSCMACSPPPCVVDCEGNVDEGEANCGVADADSDGVAETVDDTTNGGCNVDVGCNCCIARPDEVGCDFAECQDVICNVLGDDHCCNDAWDAVCATQAASFCGCCMGEPVYRFTSVACGDIVCGTASASGVVRDTDWFQLTVTEPTFVTTTLSSTFASVSGPIDTGGSGNCDDATLIDPVVLGGGCIDAVNGPNLLTPGTWWFVVAPGSSFTPDANVGAVDVPCPSEYELAIECEPLQPSPPPRQHRLGGSPRR